MRRKIVGLGKYSAVISIPREFLKKLGWRKGQMLEVISRGRSLLIKDYKNR